MTTIERLNTLETFVYERLCKGRRMKGRGADDLEIQYGEPRTFIGLYPERMMGGFPYSVTPGILITLTGGHAKNMQEMRFDRYNSVMRNKDLGKTMRVQFLLTVYDPGVRKPGAPVPEREGEGLATLWTWIDELEAELLGAQNIGDLFVWDESIDSGMLTEQNAIKDTRPVYMGVLNCIFGTLAFGRQNEEIRGLLS